MDAPWWELVITKLECMRTGVHRNPKYCQEICTIIRETCHSIWNVTVPSVCNEEKCWRGLQCLQSLTCDIFWLWGIDWALPLLHFSLSWALLPSSWEMDLPLGPDPISNGISKNLPICFDRNWSGSLLPASGFTLYEGERGHNVCLFLGTIVYLDPELRNVNLTSTNAEKMTGITPECSISLRRTLSSRHESQRPWYYVTPHSLGATARAAQRATITAEMSPTQWAAVENNILKPGLNRTNCSGTTQKVHHLVLSFWMHQIRRARQNFTKPPSMHQDLTHPSWLSIWTQGSSFWLILGFTLPWVLPNR